VTARVDFAAATVSFAVVVVVAVGPTVLGGVVWTVDGCGTDAIAAAAAVVVVAAAGAGGFVFSVLIIFLSSSISSFLFCS